MTHLDTPVMRNVAHADILSLVLQRLTPGLVATIELTGSYSHNVNGTALS